MRRLLVDPITGREFELSDAQIEIFGALDGARDLRAAAERASSLIGMEIAPELIEEMLAEFDRLALLEPGEADRIDRELDAALAAEIERAQREARRAFFRERRREKLEAALETMRALPYYARALPEPLPVLKEPEDVARLPLLDKATLRANFGAFLSGHEPSDVVWMSTSGTTGDRQQVARSRADWEASQPFTWTLNRAVRDVFGERYCRLTTPICNGTECHIGRATREERTRGPRLALETTTQIASLPDEAVARMARELEEHEPRYLLVDPTYLAIFAAHAERLGIRLPRVQVVITSYELSSALHRDRIARAFECPVYAVYGATEFGATILECEAGRHHVNPESAIVEILRDGREAGSSAGRIVVTTLDKKVMPLLRYDTGDLAIRATTPCDCAWGETDTLASLEGRSADAIVSPVGEEITPAAVDRAIAPAASGGIVTYCLVQIAEATYRLELLPSPSITEAEVARVLDAVHGVLGAGARVKVARRRELVPAASGKFRLSYAEPHAARTLDPRA
jgi:phenylacetate-CoA ligase